MKEAVDLANELFKAASALVELVQSLAPDKGHVGARVVGQLPVLAQNFVDLDYGLANQLGVRGRALDPNGKVEEHLQL